jgi:hypothetical protein
VKIRALKEIGKWSVKLPCANFKGPPLMPLAVLIFSWPLHTGERIILSSSVVSMYVICDGYFCQFNRKLCILLTGSTCIL